MNLTPVQQHAIAARGNIIVVAGAGTGKTSTLVERCMALLEEGCSIECILMVTFTEAAATEMRGRIREALQKKLESLEAKQADGSHREHFQKQLALLDSALISTLHSFCMQLVRDHFFELGIDPDISVLDDQQIRPLIQQLLDAVFERHYAGSTETDQAVRKLIRIQGRGSDERIRTLVLKLHRYSQSLVAPEKWIEQQRALFAQPEPQHWREWFAEGFQEWRALWLPMLRPFIGNAAVALATNALEAVSANNHLPEISHALHSIKAADEDEKNWPRGSKKNVRDHIKAFFEETDFLVSLANTDKSDPLAEDWELVRHDMLALLDLTREFAGEFATAKREMGGVDFADLEQFALRVLREPQSGNPTAAAQQWQQQLEYLFVDEYQDINAAQDAILSALSRDESKANRFLVGDVKQSIYRFRLADPTIFRGYERLWESGKMSHRISLTENFRSRQGVLDFVNPLFSALMRDAIGGVPYEPLQFGNPENRADLSSKPGDAPRVEFHLVAKLDAEESRGNGDNTEPSDVADLLVTEREARLVALRLRELKEQQQPIWDKTGKRFRPAEWRDMAVLLRSPSSRAEAFAKEFANLGIPIEAARAGFFESTEVSDLVSLLKLLDNPLQDVPLLAVLRSPLVGMSLAELAAVRTIETSAERVKFFWLAARQFVNAKLELEIENDQTTLARSARWKLNQFFQQLERWRQLIRQSSVSHCLEIVLAETFYEVLLRAEPRGEERLANVRRFLELAREYDPYQRQGLFRFLRFIRAQEETPMELEPSPATRDAVQLTSIHRSKGLEFPVVVVAGMGWQFNTRDLHENILLDERYGLCPKVSPSESDQRYPSLPHWLARRRQHRELLGEELRLLYVAMTRARDLLVLTASSTRKDEIPWPSEEAHGFADQEVLSARCYFDWLRLWLRTVTRTEDWTSDREGISTLLSWKIYDENDSRLAIESKPAGVLSITSAGEPPNEAELLKVRQRIAWKYPFASATEQRAKTSVTELRRSETDEEADIARFAQRNIFVLPGRTKTKLSAADIGVAHHRFLQRVSLDSASSESSLKTQAAALLENGWLNAEELEALDFGSLARFWKSELGQEITANFAAVQRELQFTAGLTSADLAALNLHPKENLPPDEVVVVQGVVDLAVILDREIWIVDFKTDAITELELAGKVNTYEPQLKLYALALSRIYNRPVTNCVLYFLAVEAAVPVEI
jgi:ATP-dependent helicase/nuclease subunit A